MAQAPKTPTKSTISAGSVEVKRSVARVVLLSIITFGLYGLYWFYASRVQVSQELGTHDNAGWQTVGLLVPILNYFIIFWLWRDIDKAQKSLGLAGFSAGGFLGVIIAASLLGWIPVLGWALGVAAIVVYCMVVAKLNEYWDKKTNGRAVEAKFSSGEIIVTVIGVGLLVLWIILLVTGAIFGESSSTIDTTSPIYNY